MTAKHEFPRRKSARPSHWFSTGHDHPRPNPGPGSQIQPRSSSAGVANDRRSDRLSCVNPVNRRARTQPPPSGAPPMSGSNRHKARAARASPSRDFLPWRFSNAGHHRRLRRAVLHRPASENLLKSGSAAPRGADPSLQQKADCYDPIPTLTTKHASFETNLRGCVPRAPFGVPLARDRLMAPDSLPGVKSVGLERQRPRDNSLSSPFRFTRTPSRRPGDPSPCVPASLPWDPDHGERTEASGSFGTAPTDGRSYGCRYMRDRAPVRPG